MGPDLNKGARTEELLRQYFLSLGFFVARGVKFRFQEIEATDVDLWLYMRPSSLSRERLNVDIKSKSSPKAIERVVWAKGLQSMLELDGCVVATTAKGSTVKDFADLHRVCLLDGNFVSRLTMTPDRLSEEGLALEATTDRDDKLSGGWIRRLEEAKTRLLFGLDFDGCNSWLEDCRFFFEQCIIGAHRSAACRFSYICLSHLLIGLDYASRSLALEDREQRRTKLDNGFRYGQRGKAHFDETLLMAERLVGATTASSTSVTHTIRDQLGSLKTELLSEFFSRPEIMKNLFSLAKGFERSGYSNAFIRPSTLPTEHQSVLGVLLDYHGVERRRFYDSLETR